MGQYISKYTTIADYEAAVASGLDTPHTALVKENMTVYFHEYVEPMNVITYEANAKLAETTTSSSSGLHTNAFNTTIKSHTFENGVGMIEFNADVTSIGDWAFYACRGLANVTIPDSVTSIGGHAFQDCSGLTSITIPDGVTRIGNNAFGGCSSLTSITIPNGVTSIEYGAFFYCTGLTSVTIGNGVTSIGDVAFDNCDGLTSITIGSGVTSIGEYAFSWCTSLTSIICTATTAPTIAQYTFQSVKTGGTLTVPTGSSGYDVWMDTGDFYLGKYNWTKVEQS